MITSLLSPYFCAPSYPVQFLANACAMAGCLCSTRAAHAGHGRALCPFALGALDTRRPTPPSKFTHRYSLSRFTHRNSLSRSLSLALTLALYLYLSFHISLSLSLSLSLSVSLSLSLSLSLSFSSPSISCALFRSECVCLLTAWLHVTHTAFRRT